MLSFHSRLLTVLNHTELLLALAAVHGSPWIKRIMQLLEPVCSLKMQSPNKQHMQTVHATKRQKVQVLESKYHFTRSPFAYTFHIHMANI